MTLWRRTRLLSLVLLAAISVSCFAQISTPTITKIDPPNWWPSLPDPMLLVYGTGLDHAHFSVNGAGIRLLRSKASENGHYAFLWLATQKASAQTLRIEATNSSGAAQREFTLKERKPAAGRYQGFSSKDVMYLIMTDRFADGDAGNNQPGYDRSKVRGWHGGDFQGIEQHLDYLKSLGVTTLWTTPVSSNGTMPDSYHGYAAVDLYSVDSHFGTMSSYQELADALHARGMKLVLDVVPNHIGVEHSWVHDSPTPDWFHGTLEHHIPAHYNFEALIDPHAAPSSYVNITNGWFTDAMPDMNQENPLVSQYLIQNAVWWIESAGLDGLRIDTFPYVGRAFWQDFHRTIHSVYPGLTTVGEVFNADPTITSFFAGGVAQRGIDTGLDTPFDFPMYFAIRDVLAHDKPMSELSGVLRQDHLYPHPERLVDFIGNHDTKRFLSEANASPARLKLAFGLLATLRGMPTIYSGDEIAMLGGEDPDNRRDFPGGFPGQSHDAFNASGRTEQEQAMFSWTSQLFQIRAAHPEIQSGEQQDVFADDTAFAFVRGAKLSVGCTAGGTAKEVLVILNKADQARDLRIPAKDTALASCSKFTPLIAGDTEKIQQGNGDLTITMPATGFAIFEVQ
ncbi:MAG TPA: alpha-amylase family glycosyl hydrolase [Acidisarcina sp.]|nr:alpha-amylase family glycosyl hydrolase [Acidisarcina sp.]